LLAADPVIDGGALSTAGAVGSILVKLNSTGAKEDCGFKKLLIFSKSS